VTKGAQQTEQLSKIEITIQTSQRSWSEVKNQVTPLHPKSRSRQEQRTIPFVSGKSTQSKQNSFTRTTKTRAENRKTSDLGNGGLNQGKWLLRETLIQLGAAASKGLNQPRTGTAQIQSASQAKTDSFTAQRQDNRAKRRGNKAQKSDISLHKKLKRDSHPITEVTALPPSLI
jgi:hypothetical protein